MDSDKPMIAFLEGPYGIPSINFESECYRIIVLISGGIGVTPNQAICNDLIEAHSKGKAMLKIVFIWVVKDLRIVHAMIDSNHFPIKTDDVLLPLADDKLDSMDVDVATIQADTCEKKSTSRHSIDKSSLLYTEIYRTSKVEISDSDLEKNYQYGDAIITQGRPDFSHIFSRINEFAASRGEQRIGVSICGPDAMVIDATKACREQNQDTVRWDTHFEVFNL